MPQQYKITWVKKGERMPLTDSSCPKCNDGIICRSKFNDGVYCNSCKWQWRPSKFDDKNPKNTTGTEKVIHYEDNEEQIKNALKTLNDRFDELGAYLTRKLGN